MKINIWKMLVDIGFKYLFIKISMRGILFYNLYFFYKINCILYNVYLNLLILIIVVSIIFVFIFILLVEILILEIKELLSVIDIYLIYRIDSVDIIELYFNKKDIFDVKLVIIVFVFVVFIVVFVLVVGGIIFCCVYKRKFSYFF